MSHVTIRHGSLSYSSNHVQHQLVFISLFVRSRYHSSYQPFQPLTHTGAYRGVSSHVCIPANLASSLSTVGPGSDSSLTYLTSSQSAICWHYSVGAHSPFTVTFTVTPTTKNPPLVHHIPVCRVRPVLRPGMSVLKLGIPMVMMPVHRPTQPLGGQVRLADVLSSGVILVQRSLVPSCCIHILHTSSDSPI